MRNRKRVFKSRAVAIQDSSAVGKKRRPWTYLEDQAIKKLVQAKGTKQWTLIANLLQSEFGIKGRNGKQCRERWHNHLNPIISKQPWALEEEIRLFELHQSVGNKWADIAKVLPGRTDNSIKNHFYSTLRRHQRKILGSEDSQKISVRLNNQLAEQILIDLYKKNGDIDEQFHLPSVSESKIYSDLEELMDLDGLFVEGTSIQIPRDIHIISSIDEQPMMFERIDYTNLHFEDLDEIFIMNQ